MPGSSWRSEAAEAGPLEAERREVALDGSLTGFDGAARAESASIDPEVIWRRVEARLNHGPDLSPHRPASRVRRCHPRRTGSWRHAPFGRPALPALTAAAIVAVASMPWWWPPSPSISPAPSLDPVQLNLSLWQPTEIAGDPMGRSTDDLVAVLRAGDR